jgi:hypothetical protein
MTSWNRDSFGASGRRPLALAAAGFLFLCATHQAAFSATARTGTSNRPVAPIQNSMKLKCQVTSDAIMTGDSDAIKLKPPAPTSTVLTLDVVDGQLLTAAPERARLRLLSTEATTGSMFFEELTVTGNVALWSFHGLKNGRILFSQQMSANASGPTQEKVVLFTQAGFCEASGGDGLPVRK